MGRLDSWNPKDYHFEAKELHGSDMYLTKEWKTINYKCPTIISNVSKGKHEALALTTVLNCQCISIKISHQYLW